MQTKIAPQFKGTKKAKIADSILRSCVHCGFCNATCPTYLNTGTELNSPRGRIYLIKQLLEGEPTSQTSLEHLNLCLQCRNCESTCPSGVEYGKLYEIGQEIIQETVHNPLVTKLKYLFFTKTLPYPNVFKLIYWSFLIAKPFLPTKLKKKFKKARIVDPLPKVKTLDNGVILFKGCVQKVLAPEINQSIENLLTKLNTSSTSCNKEQCCGAIDWHAGNKNAALIKMKANIDIWSIQNKPLLISASGCSAFIKQYAEHLESDSEYAYKAQSLLVQTFDTVDYFDRSKIEQLDVKASEEKIACHTPCTLQHWQKNPETLENNLRFAGFTIIESDNKHLCCGSAGLYSVMNPELSNKIKAKKITDLTVNQPTRIVSNNIGCINHLQGDLDVQIQHWCELLDEASN